MADGAPLTTWHSLSTRGPRTEQAGRWPLAPSSGRVAMLASPFRSDMASGTANGGRCLPAAIPREPPPLLRSVLKPM